MRAERQIFILSKFTFFSTWLELRFARGTWRKLPFIYGTQLVCSHWYPTRPHPYSKWQCSQSGKAFFLLLNWWPSFFSSSLFSLLSCQTTNAHLHQQAECDAYEKKIASVGGIHLFLCGIGTDGKRHRQKAKSTDVGPSDNGHMSCFWRRHTIWEHEMIIPSSHHHHHHQYGSPFWKVNDNTTC